MLALLESPLGELLNATATGTLAEVAPLRWRDGAAVTKQLHPERCPICRLLAIHERPRQISPTFRDLAAELAHLGRFCLNLVFRSV